MGLPQLWFVRSRASGLPLRVPVQTGFWRDVVDVVVMTPAVAAGVVVAEENTTALGDPKLAWFRMLKNSARNCRRTPFRHRYTFPGHREVPRFARPGPIQPRRALRFHKCPQGD